MTEKELRKLGRTELLEMLLEQSRQVEELEQELAGLKKKLADKDKELTEAREALENREIVLDKAGSIAEASLMLSGIFDAAQLACRQYTENIKRLSERQESVCVKMEEESRARAERILADAEQKRKDMDRETRSRCNEMLQKARTESQAYWDDVSGRLESFYAEHAGLQELLSIVTPRKQTE